jgi:hypothetical protein
LNLTLERKEKPLPAFLSSYQWDQCLASKLFFPDRHSSNICQIGF